jgi:hypothetical protein
MDPGFWSSTISALRFDLFHNVHAFDDFSENDMFPIKPWGRSCRDEELSNDVNDMLAIKYRGVTSKRSFNMVNDQRGKWQIGEGIIKQLHLPESCSC